MFTGLGFYRRRRTTTVILKMTLMGLIVGIRVDVLGIASILLFWYGYPRILSGKSMKCGYPLRGPPGYYPVNTDLEYGLLVSASKPIVAIGES